jgi:hypothetical protein
VFVHMHGSSRFAMVLFLAPGQVFLNLMLGLDRDVFVRFLRGLFGDLWSDTRKWA